MSKRLRRKTSKRYRIAVARNTGFNEILPFMGEMMVCKECGREEKSDPKIQSGWTSITIDDRRLYVCPDCWDEINGEINAPF